MQIMRPIVTDVPRSIGHKREHYKMAERIEMYKLRWDQVR